uniref:DEAD/DEAH-box helicase domain-containing protein n=1 Tax=Anopheles epiroticus TaxID=199890 RepID=A0A182PVD5_9DIPT
ELINILRLNRLRNQHNIHVKKNLHGPKVPNIIETSEQLSTEYGAPNRLVSNQTITEQMQTITILLKTRSLHASAPPGSGKTAAILNVILHHLRKKTDAVWILGPNNSRELAKQSQREAPRLGGEINLSTYDG